MYRTVEKITKNIIESLSILINKFLSEKFFSIKELFSFFDGEMNLEEAIEKIKQNTRRFAKRQISWFKRDENIQHVKMENAFQKIVPNGPERNLEKIPF